MMIESELVSTQNLMAALGIGSYNTVKNLQKSGVITPVMVGKVRKWNLKECVESIKNYKHEKATV